MKHFILFITITTLLISSCGNDDPATSGSDEPVMFDCATFFDSGDYSSVCFVGNEDMLVEIDQVPSGTTCIAQLGVQPNTVNDYVTISFFETTVLPSIAGVPSVAEGIFTSIKNSAVNVTDVSDLGNQAFTTMDDESYQTWVEKQLVVRFSNMILTFDTGYESADGPHCANDHEELIKLAKIILSNF